MEQTSEQYAAGLALYRLLERRVASPSTAETIRQAVGEFAGEVLLELRSPHLGTATIMALTACRWGELGLLDLPALFDGCAVAWRPLKGSAHRCIWIPNLGSFPDSPLLSARTPPHVVQYPCHAAAVRHAVRRAGHEPSGPSLKGTHVWRHLRAWDLLRSGHPVEHIQAALGHHRGDSTAHYLRSMPPHVRELINS